MVVNFLLDDATDKTQSNDEALTEKEKDRDFWSAL